jgi:uncharacterized protein YecT (DUF1311 family)
MKLFSLLLILVLPVISAQDDESKCCCTTYDTSVCLSKIRDKVDAKLNRTYQEALQMTARFGDTDVVNLKEAEKNWITYRDAECKAEYGLWSGGSGGPNAHAMCVIRLTKQRTAELENSYTKMNR